MINGDHRAVGVYLLRVEEPRLTVQIGWPNRVFNLVLSLFFGMGSAIAVGFLVVLEIRDPGGFGKFLFEQKLKQHAAPGDWVFQVVSVGAFSLVVLLFVALSLFWLYFLYRDLVREGHSWVFDLSRGLLLRGDRSVRNLASIRMLSVAIAKRGSSFLVTLLPESAPATARKMFQGPRDDLFSFDRREDAVEFAEALAKFLGIEVAGRAD
jgi:hypothetical protein